MLFLSDWSPKVNDLARKYETGVEIQSLCHPENLGCFEEMEKKILVKAESISQLSFHGPFSDLVPVIHGFAA